MSISSVSFWQQDRNYWNQAQSQDNSIAATNAVISAMQSAETNLGKGLASIANSQALNRVNSTLVSEIENVLNGSSGSSGSSSSSGTGHSTSASSKSSSTSSSSSGSSSSPQPATGIGTAALTTGTTLSSLGILPGGTITISAGYNSTTYTSTGTDTVGDLVNAINVDLSTNAQVTATLNSSGKLVITSRNTKDSIAIVGSGTDATAIGFGIGHAAFQPTQPSGTGTSSTSSSSSSKSSSSSSSSSTSSSTNSSTSSSSSSTAKSAGTVSSLAELTQQNLSSAASLLSASGVSGTLVNMLA